MGAEEIQVSQSMDGQRDMSIDVQGSPPSFDDFDAIETVREEFVEAKVNDVKSKLPSKTNKEKEDGDNEEGSEEVEESTQGKRKGQIKDIPAKTKKESSDSEEGDEESGEKSTNKEIADVAKILKLKHGDSELELPLDLEIPFKADGADHKITLAEIQNQFAGKVSWERRFRELDQTRKKFIQERQAFTEKVEPFIKMSKDNPMEAIFHLVDSFGGNSHSFYKELRNSLIPKVEEYSLMSEAERRAHDASSEVEFLRKQNESITRKHAERESKEQLIRKANELKEAHGISEEQFASGFKELAGLAENGLVQVGEEGLTVERVIAFQRVKPYADKAAKLLSSVSPELIKDAENVRDITEYLMDTPGITDEEVVSLIREASGVKAKQISRQITEKVQQNGVVRTKVVEAPDKVELFDDFDD